LAFTFSCSSGDDNSNGSGGSNFDSNLSDLPKQLYFVVGYDDDDNAIKEKYDGNGDILLRLYSEAEDIFLDEPKPAGKIQNGQVSLSLPDIDSKFLYKKSGFCSEWNDKECNFSITPENLALFFQEGIYVNTPNKSNCRMGLVLIDGGAETYKRSRRDAWFIYSSESGKITGTSSCRSAEDGSGTLCNNFDLNLSKGWNAGYSYNGVNGKYNTTNLSKTEGRLEWWIKSCGDH